ncbi:MAG: protein kinase, partial [candidate division Zixibacteria bacterium]|nr:protein kinase [candidate division Zixibacteria bacterium]
DILYEFKQSSPVSEKVVLVKIDDLTIAEIGPWPWSAEEISDLVAAVGSGKPRTALLDFDIPESDRKSAENKNKTRAKSKSKKHARKSDNIIADQLLWMKNVTVTYDVLASQKQSREVTNPQYLFRNALMTNSDVFTLPPDQALSVRTTLMPPKEVADAATRLGFRYTALDESGALRSEPLIMNYNGYYYPSASLAAASHFLRFSPESIIINGGESVALPDRVIPTSSKGEMLLNFPTGQTGFKTYSATDILNERIDFSDFENKLVVITLAIGSYTEYYKSPISPELPHYLKTAIALDNILEMNYLQRADSKLGWYVLILLLIGAVSAYGLPLIASLHRLVVIALALIGLANVNYFLFNSFNLMASSLFIALQLVLFLVASPLMALDYSFVTRALKKALRRGQKEEVLQAITRHVSRKLSQEGEESQRRSVSALARSESEGFSDEFSATSFSGEDSEGATRAIRTGAETSALTQSLAQGLTQGLTQAMNTSALGARTTAIKTGDGLSETVAASGNKTIAIGADKTAAIPTGKKASKDAIKIAAKDKKHGSVIGKPADGFTPEEVLDPGGLTDYGALSSANLDTPVDVDSFCETNYGEIDAGEAIVSDSSVAQSKSEQEAANLADEKIDKEIDEEIEVGPSVPESETGAKAPSDPQPVSPDREGLVQDKQPSDEPQVLEQAPGEVLSDTPNAAMMEAVKPGQRLGRYELQGIVGKGAMGLVFRGVDPAINRPVALKTIRLDFLTDPQEMEELKARLFLEAQAAGKLSHPNIVVIYDVGSEGTTQYIAMEFLEGQTLEEMIKRKVDFNFKIVAKIIYQICSALQYAHEQGIVHRDIKPANIMVMPDYSIKVLDFGIARIESTSMTKTGVAMGTPNYISPEQLKGHKVDGRSDIFSLGIVVYEMLIGERPFKGDNLTSLIYNIANTEAELPSKSNPRVPPLFDHVCQRALKKDPADRYQKAGDMANALSDFVQSFAKR